MARSEDELASIIAILRQMMLEDGDDSLPEDCYRFVERGDEVYAMSLTEDQQEVGGVLRWHDADGWQFVAVQADLPCMVPTQDEADLLEAEKMLDWWRMVRIQLARLGVKKIPVELSDPDRLAFMADTSAWAHARYICGATPQNVYGFRMAIIVDQPDGRQTICQGTVAYFTHDWDQSQWVRYIHDNKITHLGRPDLSDLISIEDFLDKFEEGTS